jgi:hypothetical protein
MPVPADDMPVKKTDAAVTDFHRVRRPLTLIFPVKEIIPEFLSGDPVGFLTGVFNEHPDGPGVTFLRATAFSVNLQSLHGFSVPLRAEYLCHNTFSFFLMVERWGVLWHKIKNGENVMK